ncbi:transmembrane protein [Mycobacterium tuberculosis]|nr:transmembrane protein [Mycobacterium tuberculosis]
MRCENASKVARTKLMGLGKRVSRRKADVDYPEEAPEESQAVDAGVIGSEEPSEEASEATEESAVSADRSDDSAK